MPILSPSTRPVFETQQELVAYVTKAAAAGGAGASGSTYTSRSPWCRLCPSGEVVVGNTACPTNAAARSPSRPLATHHSLALILHVCCCTFEDMLCECHPMLRSSSRVAVYLAGTVGVHFTRVSARLGTRAVRVVWPCGFLWA